MNVALQGPAGGATGRPASGARHWARARAVAWGAAALALAGCASAPPPAAGLLTGRMALKVEATTASPAQSLSAGFELAGDDRQGQLRLLSPLGTQLAEARWAPGQAQLRDSQGLREFADLADLARQALGEAVPLAALPHWLAARPWPAEAATPQDQGFAQLGWTIDTREAANGRILAQRTSAPAIRLLVQLDR